MVCGVLEKYGQKTLLCDEPLKDYSGSRSILVIFLILVRTPLYRNRIHANKEPIVESPQPLPNKRDTLGIFQFPSGEMSDSAVYHSAFSPVLRAARVLTNVSREDGVGKSELDPVEYPSSFFDDYDEQDDSEDLDSDNNIDKSTLWEILSLLHSKDSPSNDSNESSLPLTINTRDALESYDDDTHFGKIFERQCMITEMSTELREAIPDSLIQVPIRPLAMISIDCPKLWINTPLPNLEADTKGLPQPDSKVWESYVLKSKSDLRSGPQLSSILPVLTTFALWRRAPAAEPSQSVTFLWGNPKALEERSFTAPHILVKSTSLLWVPQAIKFEQSTSSHTLQNKQNSNTLWTPDVEAETKASISQSNILPAPISIVCKVRESQASLDGLTSSQLWSGRQALGEEHHWISESNVRPESPSFQSESSSGASSSTSDTLSMKSTSTMASSIGGSFKSVEVSLPWDRNLSKNEMSATLDSKEPPASPVSQSATQRLPSVRESRVLAFRGLFESRASRSEDTSAVHKQPRSNRASFTNLTAATVDYDVATRRPLFFTQSLVSSTADVHPTSIGHFKRPYCSKARHSIDSTASAIEPHLWINLLAKVESISNIGLLWLKDPELPILNKFEHVSKETIRRPTVPESLSVLVLELSDLWRRPVAVNSRLNWLSVPCVAQSHLWSPAPKHENAKNIDLRTVAKYSSPDMFSRLEEDRIRKVTISRPLPTLAIESSQLFESGTPTPHAPVHWLHSTSNMSTAPSRSLP